MRVIVMFDLPVETADERSAYAHFRKNLIKDGYIMMQESVYCKLVMNPISGQLAIQRIRNLSPKQGIIQALMITEKQYAQIEYIIGGPTTNKENSTDRLVIF